MKIAGPHPRGSDSAGLGWEPRICIFHQFPGDAVSGGLGQHFENIRVHLFSDVVRLLYFKVT